MKNLLIFTLFLFCACKNTNQKSQLPLNQEQLQSVLKDLHLFEAEFNPVLFRTDSLYPELLNQYDSLFAVNNTTKADFYKTFDAYSIEYPDDLDTIYTHLSREFDKTRDSLLNVERDERKTSDRKQLLKPEEIQDFELIEDK